jgi:enterochelin esterase-like enzyme
VPVEISADARSVTFTLADPARRLAGVRLVDEIGLPGPSAYAWASGGWRLERPRPDVARMEYLLEIEDHNGRRTTIPDPGNPLRAGGAFGDKSVVEFPEYDAPAWLGDEPVRGRHESLTVEAAPLGAPVTVTVWTPDGLDADDPAPLVVAHDGPEYDRLGALTRYVGALLARGAVPPVRVALLDPGDRNRWYAANSAYAAALCEDVLPEVGPATVRVGVGVSLGALAMLHAHRFAPGTFDALLLQSGSFFTPELDPQESEFSRFSEVTAFVAEVAHVADDPAPVPTVLTCGTVEENRANNRAMAGHLRRLGYPTTFAEVRDAHNYTAWRDALHPHLARLVVAVVPRAA